MEKLIYYLNKYKTQIFIGIGIVLCLIIILFWQNNSSNYNDGDVEILYQDENQEITLENIKVNIKGAVRNPGVYQLEENSRVEDAIIMAGGLSEDADTSIINLSKKLYDENVIIIYSKEEVRKIKNGNTIIQYIENECNCPSYENSACINPDTFVNFDEDESTTGKVSINKATLAELQTLPGIGKTKAQAIIDYRSKNGLFKSVEDLKKVSGIGNATFEKIKNDITI